ncbi:MAG: (p)ppGpp synthetase, partial [Tissierellia bacterium]|nr:(p)ppGpp synthetase [Tissierellia bacterium]
HYGTAENMIKNLSDLIGVRIECRFIEDEDKIYVSLLNLFNTKEENGYFSCSKNPNVWLNLAEDQPVLQKNGFEIYKIDGRYRSEKATYNFELQIKSMVNIFWGEIDHRVLYKNFNYMLAEDFFRDIMVSIKDNLIMIDRQLMLVFDQLNALDASDGTSGSNQLTGLISKIIHDIYISKVREEVGFVVDFKKSTDVIVDYLFLRDRVKGDSNLGNNFLRLYNRLTEIRARDLNFSEDISFKRKLSFHDNYTRQIGYKILSVINKDFRWNLFFRTIFDIENKDPAADFEDFVIFLRYKFSQPLIGILDDKPMTEQQKRIVLELLLQLIIERFSIDIDLDFISEPSLSKLHANIINLFRGIESYSEWIMEEDRCRKMIMGHRYDQ